jgi:NTE family protein
MLIRKETLRELDGLGERDVLIRPELGDYGSTNFDDIDEVIEPGRLAAVAVAAHLAHLSMDEVTYGEHQASRKAFESSEATIDFVRVVSDGPLAASVLESKLKSAPGDVLDTASLAADLDRLYGLEYYEHVGYRLVTEDDRTGVEFQTRAKSWGPNFLKFGLSLEDNFEGSTEFNVSARLTATGLNSRGAEWRNDVQVGTSPRIESEFYQPLGLGSQFFLAPRIKLEQRNLNTFAGMDSIARYRVSEAEGGLDLGWTLGHWGEMRAGLLRGRGTAEVKVGDPSLPNDDFDDGGVLVRLAIDTLDDAQIAKHGTDAIVEWHGSHQSFGADSRKDTLFAAIDHAWSWGLGDRNTLRAGVEYATTYRSENLVQDFFTLGGFLRLSGLGRGEISGPHTGMARLVYMRRLGESGGGFFDMPLYIGGSLETGNAWQSRSEISFGSMLVNGSMFAGLDTTFGRLFVGAGFSEGGESSLYLFFGNPRPLER